MFIRNDNGVQCSYVGTWSDDLENSGILNTKLLSNNTGDVTINWIGEAKQLTLSGYFKADGYVNSENSTYTRDRVVEHVHTFEIKSKECKGNLFFDSMSGKYVCAKDSSHKHDSPGYCTTLITYRVCTGCGYEE